MAEAANVEGPAGGQHAEGTAGNGQAQAGGVGPAFIGWYFLDAQQQSQGPYPAAQIPDLWTSGFLTPTTLLWAEGQPNWTALSEIPSLYTSVSKLPQPTVSSTSASEQKKAVLERRPQVTVKKQSVRPRGKDEAGVARRMASTEEDELARFQAEMAKVEAEAEALKRRRNGTQAEPSAEEATPGEGAGPPDPPDRPSSPPEGEENFIDDDGTEYQWDKKLHAWVPLEGLKTGAPLPAYAPEEMTYVQEEEIIPSMPTEREGDEENEEQQQAAGQKRKAEDEAKKKEAEKPEGWFELKVNTSVYVTGLPEDVTAEEVAEVFGKCGVIKEDTETRKLRIKIYRDRATGLPKGDGLVTYLKEPSVDLSVKILDGTPLRAGGNPNMTVTVAKFEQKGDYQPKKKDNTNKKKKKMQKLEQKRLGWGGFDDKPPLVPITVILKHMFTLDELAADPQFLPELESDIAEECAKLGEIERLKVYDKNPQGVVSVKFKDKEAGKKCISMMNGRWFGGRQVVAEEYDGTTNYAAMKESAEEEEVRLERFARELEQQ